MSGVTEFCVLTAPGRGAVAAIGLRGPDAERVVATLFLPHGPQTMAKSGFQVGRIHFGRWRVATGEELIIARTDAETFEINCHGGRAALAAICADLAAAECRATSAELWLTAETRGDLVAAEARQALAAASTLRTAAILLNQHAGALSRELATVIGAISAGKTEVAQAQLVRLQERAELGLRLTSAWKIVLAGEPNVGKSSLINRLMGFERTIVHETPGTTRDAITVATALDGWPVELCDTAGQRTSPDTLEAAGIRRAQAAVAAADLVLVILEARTLIGLSAAQVARCVAAAVGPEIADRPHLVVANKCDLLDADAEPPEGVLATSATSGAGMDGLIAAICRRLGLEMPPPSAGVPFTQRQFGLLQQAREELTAGHDDDAVFTLAGIVHAQLPELPRGW